jgi:hypothetical protein
MKTAVELLVEQLELDVFATDEEMAIIIKAKEMEKEREKSIFSIAYRMTPIEFGKEYCEAEFEKFNKTFKQQEQ